MSQNQLTEELPRAERYKNGKAQRQEAPRSSHGDWQPAAGQIPGAAEPENRSL